MISLSKYLQVSLVLLCFGSVGCSADENFESPMPELDSVDEVTLTPEEEERAIEQAREEEKHTKLPSKPKTQKQKN